MAVFTVAEARAELSRLRPLLEEVVALRADAAELASAARSGGAPSPIGGLAELKAAQARLDELLTEVTRHGVELKGLAPLLLDFPAVFDGTPVLLCWLEGDTELAWFHRVELGLAGRRRLSDPAASVPGGATLTTVNLSAPDPAALARFYARLLGWPIVAEEPGWVLLRPPQGGVGLSCQTETDYRAPAWPAGPGDQQMMMHLDIRVDDLAEAGEHALACGARRAEHQPQQDVRVYLDPAGHPFCLWVET